MKKLQLVLIAKRILVFVKYGFKKSTILTNYYNIRVSFKCDYSLEARYAYLPQIKDGIFQPQTVKIFEKVIKKNDTIIDCGSNFGFFSLLACQLTGKNGKVFAFETSKQGCEGLVENAKINNFTNLITSNYAVSDVSKKEYSFYGNDGGGTIIKGNPAYDTNKSSEKVLSISLDDFFAKKNVRNLKLIKLDVEGYEYFVFKGMKKLIKNNPDAVVVFELTKDAMKIAGYSIRDVLSELNDMGLDNLYDINHPDYTRKINTTELLYNFDNKDQNLFELLAMNNKMSKLFETTI